MEYMNQTYEAVDSQPRPVSYLNPCVIRDSCIDEENYETLTDVQTQLNNIYEHLPTAGGDTLQPTRSERNDLPLKKKDNAGPFVDNEIKKIKQDLRKTKVLVIILATIFAVFVIISLTAVAIAVTTPPQNKAESQSEADGPQAIIAPNNKGIDESIPQMITNLSTELQKLQNTVMDLRNNFTFHVDQLQHLNQQITDQSNVTSLANQVLSLQNQSRLTGSNIMQVESTIGDLILAQSILQSNFNATQSNLTQVHHQIGSVQNQLSTTGDKLESVDEKATALQGQLTSTQANMTTLNMQVNTLRRQLTTTEGNLTLVSSQAANIQASLNSHLRSPIQLYQNCRQDTVSCSVSNLANNNRRLHCNTPPLNATITGFYTLDMRCEHSGERETQLLAPSLQNQSSTSYFCQCSSLTPRNSGFIRLSTPPSPGICTLLMTRCPLNVFV